MYCFINEHKTELKDSSITHQTWLLNKKGSASITDRCTCENYLNDDTRHAIAIFHGIIKSYVADEQAMSS